MRPRRLAQAAVFLDVGMFYSADSASYAADFVIGVLTSASVRSILQRRGFDAVDNRARQICLKTPLISRYQGKAA